MNAATGTYGRARAAPGTRLNGIYEIEKLIATGGMGEIYKGRAIETGDPVAIKMIRADLAENDAALALFRKEASALHNLYNEAIVRYYVFSIDPILGCPYLAMEFVEGRSLSDILQRGPLSLDQVLILQRRLAAGLQAAHELGIIHRDVSPDNIILPGDNVARAKIIDFGIARSTASNDGTIIGSGFAGKFRYVSPEQLGMFGGDVGPKSDIYSLGLVLVQALLGHPLDMGGTQVQVLEKRRTVPDLAEVDARIRPLFKRMLQPNPADRPESMAEVAAWRVGTIDAAAAPAPGSKKKKVGFALAGIGALAAAGAAAAFFVAPNLFSSQNAIKTSGLVSREEPPPLAQDTSPRVTPSAPPAPDLAPRPDPSPSLAARPPEPTLPPLVERQPTPRAPDPAPRQPPEPAPGPVAGLPNAPLIQPTPRPAVVPRVEDIRRYIADYKGGDCFFVTPVQVTARSANIEAYGAAAAPFQTFDEAFRQANGFEAQIGLRKVTPPQCPAVSFLARVAPNRPEPPRLEVANFNLKSGEFLRGTVEGFGDRAVELLLVADDGAVHNLASFSRKTGNQITFNLKIDASGGSAPKPQILLAVASPRPLPLLTSRAPMNAERIFQQILEETGRTGQPISATAKYIKIEG